MKRGKPICRRGSLAPAPPVPLPLGFIAEERHRHEIESAVPCSPRKQVYCRLNLGEVELLVDLNVIQEVQWPWQRVVCLVLWESGEVSQFQVACWCCMKSFSPVRKGVQQNHRNGTWPLQEFLFSRWQRLQTSMGCAGTAHPDRCLVTSSLIPQSLLLYQGIA